MMTQSRDSVKFPSAMYEKSGNRRYRIKDLGKDKQNFFVLTTKTKLTSSLYPICMPQSNMIFFPPICSKIQLLPTSCPAPSGVTLISVIAEFNWPFQTTKALIKSLQLPFKFSKNLILNLYHQHSTALREKISFLNENWK